MVLIQMLLPVVTSSGQAETDARVKETRQELVEAFGGMTAYLQTPAQGVWTSPEGQRERDAVVMIEIVAEQFDRAWWQRYAATLAGRFQQDVIHVRAIAADVL
jgi:hypothetical protein